MSLLYFPGCTLKNKARNFDASTLEVFSALGVELAELERWNCCGTVFSMADDDLMLQLAPLRNLLRAEQQGGGELLVPCSMCYNTLRRAQRFAAADPERLGRIRDFMYDEPSAYRGDVEVRHPLAYLRDRVGLERVKQAVERPLGGLRLGAYYGCLLLRPSELAVDDPARPRVMEDLIAALGAEPVEFGQRAECCGAYQTLSWRAVTLRRTYEILGSACAAGARALLTSCPLCAYNLDQMQREAVKSYPDLCAMPVLYFTELMVIAMGLGWKPEWSALHEVDPQPVLDAAGA
ncbi:MAG: CoB--CoM heterodisulfide reductase iron-sulfur subunit B family protein [Deltaproteobacteria bacterium]|nr:CoB--CoM heterodisulfide reductase iron-sulfur subunit B family protein [Deltaproteobacteria bacterium]